MAGPLLITAFEPFPGVPANPTETLLRSLAACADPLLARARHLLLPTRYDIAPRALMAALDPMPRAILMTGYSKAATGLTLESRSTSHRLPDRPDAGGLSPSPADEPIQLHDSALDLSAMREALRLAGLPAAISQDAGGYVCNHLYHAALSGPCALPGGIPGLFVHVPALAETELAAESAAVMSLTEMQRGLGIVARMLLSAKDNADDKTRQVMDRSPK